MKQHAIDLLPEHIRARTQAGMVARRYTLAVLLAVGVIVVTATHAHFRAEHAQEQLRVVKAQADKVFDTERRALALQKELNDRQAVIEQYNRVAPGLPISRVIATVVNELPESMALDEIVFDVRDRRNARGSSENARRWLFGEVSGFAASDSEIAMLVEHLAAHSALRDVSLDYSRSRSVRDKSAREFRMSFWIDLDQDYRLADAARSRPDTAPDVQGDGHVQQ